MATKPFMPMSVDDLRAGQVLPGHLRDQDGRIIIPAGAVVTQEDIAGLAGCSIFVGQDWFNNRARLRAAAHARLHADMTRGGSQPKHSANKHSANKGSADSGSAHDPSSDLSFDGPPTGAATGAELRQQARHVWNTVLRLEITDADGSRRREVDVRTLNLSAGGFAFLMRQFVHPGSRVLAEFKALAGKPVVEAVVRSCTPLGGMEHRVGVQFIGDATQATERVSRESNAA